MASLMDKLTANSHSAHIIYRHSNIITIGRAFSNAQWTHPVGSCPKHSVSPGVTHAVSGRPRENTETLEKHAYSWPGATRRQPGANATSSASHRAALPSRCFRVLPDTRLQFSPTGAVAWGIPSSHIFLGKKFDCCLAAVSTTGGVGTGLSVEQYARWGDVALRKKPRKKLFSVRVISY